MTPMLYHVQRLPLDVAVIDASSQAEAVKLAEKDKSFKNLSTEFAVRVIQTKDLN